MTRAQLIIEVKREIREQRAFLKTLRAEVKTLESRQLTEEK